MSIRHRVFELTLNPAHLFILPGQACTLQSWYSTGEPLQATGALLPSGPVQDLRRVRYPLEQLCEHPDQESHEDQPGPPAPRTSGVRSSSSTRSIDKKLNELSSCFDDKKMIKQSLGPNETTWQPNARLAPTRQSYVD